RFAIGPLVQCIQHTVVRFTLPTVNGTIGFVGCGRMGGRMLRRLVAAGARGRALGVSGAAAAAAGGGGRRAGGGGAAARRGGGAVVTMLPDPAVVEMVAGELIGGLAPDTLWLEMSSSRPATTRVLAEAAAERGAALLDAPVSGGVTGAEAGTL